MVNNMPVFPSDKDRGQCLSVQAELVSQEQDRDELLIDKEGSGSSRIIVQ